jgi:hypothetical protein
MLARSTFSILLILVVAHAAAAQTAGNAVAPGAAWHNAAGAVQQASATAPVASDPPATPVTPATRLTPSVARPAAPAAVAPAAPRRAIAQYTEGNTTLPNTAGQIWREYDISPYTLRVTSTNRPEQAVVDWILRETGYEAWHGDPLAILSATKRSLRVYHTPEMQNVVADIVDRFVNSQAQSRVFGLRLVSLDQPNWQTRAQSLLHPVPTQTPGVQAWLLEKEDAAVLLADLHRRLDYREHSSPYLMVNNGQSTVVSAFHGRSYIREVAARPNVWPGFERVPGQIDEGFSLEFSPLLSLDDQTIDATIKCDIDQLEKVIPVTVDVPTAVAPRQRAQIEQPQITRCRFHERFRWPSDKVLLVGLGMVPMPIPTDGKSLLPGLSLPLGNAPPRADLLLFVESKGDAPQTATTLTAQRDPKTYRGRY